MAFLAKRRINNDTPEWCRPGGVRILETIHDMAEGACDGANGLGVPFKDMFDKTLKLYSLMTTKPEEVEARKQKEMEE